MNVLVTGATGLVGAEVCARLAARGHAVVGLRHTAPAAPGRCLPRFTGRFTPGAITWLTADVTRPGLGLHAWQRERLVGGKCRVVHAAAVTEFGHDERVYEAVNVRGTANVLDFARRGGLPLVYLSTAYVCGEHDGEFGEHLPEAPERFGNAYEESKFRAERLVRAGGEDIAVVRPSIVVGDERTGAIRSFKNVYVLLKLVADGRVRTLPGHYDACLDFVGLDRVADLVAEVTSRFHTARGRTFHAIGSNPVTLMEFSEVLAEHPSVRVPRFVPPETFQPDALPDPQRRYHERIVRRYEPYLRRRVRFDDTLTREFSRRPGTRVPAKAHLRRVLDHCFRVGYLGARAGAR